MNRDHDFKCFISEFGESTLRYNVPDVAIEEWRGKLPDQLLLYWKEEGWSGFADGLFWIVNPNDYEDLKEQWLRGTILETVDEYRVIARSAFGKLFLWGTKTGASATISCYTNSIACQAKDLGTNVTDPDDEIRMFFGFTKKKNCDIDDDNGKPLFLRALKKLGPLAQGEMYGFEPALVLGGDMKINNLGKIQLDVHLTILRGFAPPMLPFKDIDIIKPR